MSEHTQMESQVKKGKVEYLEAGADYVISNLVELKVLIDEFIYKLSTGESP